MNKVTFRTEAGVEIDGNEVVFPLFTQGSNSSYRLVGTGFFFMKPGIFITAKHCLNGDDGKRLLWMTGLVAHGHMRRLATVVPHETCDITIGVFDQQDEFASCEQCMNHQVLCLTRRTPEPNEELIHFGCDRTRFEELRVDDEWIDLSVQLRLRGYAGRYEGFDAGNPFAPWPHHFTGSHFPSGSSGGPTMDSRGFVCGVNSSSSSGYEEVPPHGRLTRVADLLDGTLKGTVLVNGERMTNSTVEELLFRHGYKLG